MKYETLYKRTKTGAIQQWDISVELVPLGTATIYKQAGQLGGKLTTHKELITMGKNIGRSNETTPGQQAESQALSDWTRKHDEGYKSLTDLGLKQEAVVDLLDTLQVCLPSFNTTVDGTVLPMLAKAVNWEKVTYPCLVQPKLDGVRCLMVHDNGQIEFLSRNGKQYTTLHHIEAEVLEYVSAGAADNFILDGEIYSDELTFQEIIAAVKKQRPDSLKLKFRAYDMLNNELQRPRLRSTIELVNNINSPLVQMVEHTTCGSKEEVKAYHDQYVSNGYEGAMIRLMDGKYGQGQRSSSLLKVKEFDESEFAFSNFEFGQRGVEDLIAKCWSKDGEKEFRAKMIGTKAQKEQLYSINDAMEGTSITIKHFGLTDDGLPRFPIGVGFRDYE